MRRVWCPKKEICAAAAQPDAAKWAISLFCHSGVAMKTLGNAKVQLQVLWCTGDSPGTWEAKTDVVPGVFPPPQPFARQSWCILAVLLPFFASPHGFAGAVLTLVSAIPCAATFRFPCSAFEGLETLPSAVLFLLLLRCIWIQRGCQPSLPITAVTLCCDLWVVNIR